jgi:hypothetical protein
VRPSRLTRSNCALVFSVSIRVPSTKYQVPSTKYLVTLLGTWYLVLAHAFRLVADSEPPAALSAPCGDYPAPAFRAHSRQESMLALARDSLRLIGSLDHYSASLLLPQFTRHN